MLVCWLTHRTDAAALAAFDAIDLPRGWRKEVLFDAAACPVPDRPRYPFTLQSFRDRGYQVDGGDDFGWQQWPLIERILDGDEAFAWLVEFDVRFTGRWTEFFRAFDDSADLLASHIRTQTYDPRWDWWTSLASPEDACPLAAYCPIMRLSHRGAGSVLDAYSAGWRGHTEVLLPTVLNARRLRVHDFGPKWYTPETLRWRPVHASTPLPNKLYHPVKPCPVC